MAGPDQEVQIERGFWDSRTGWIALKRTLLLEPLPGGSRWENAFGSLLLFTFLLQITTGILLAMSYAPAVKTAWPSVKFIQEQVPLGWYIRALHHWGASAMIILVLVHLVQVYVWGAYKRPRELTWMVGVLLLMCLLGLAFTGYLLPWDEKAYWATRVGLGIVGTVPLMGNGLRAILQGGPDLGNLTLTRFFTLHAFILPISLSLLAVAHVYLFRLQGVTPPWWQSAEQLKSREEPFWPDQAWKDLLLAFLLLIGLGLWCLHFPAPLAAEADPARPYEARPDWYFMFLFRMLRYFEGPYEVVGTFVLPFTFIVVLLLWPLLDRNPRRDPRRRPFAIGLLILGTGGLLGSTIYSIATDVRVPERAMAAHLEPKVPPLAGPMQRLQIVRIFRDNCASCHGENGSGSPVRAAMPSIPDFRSMAWQTATTDLEIVHQIQDGKEPVMPPFRGKLSKKQILGLAVYIRAFAVETAAETPPSAAETPSEEKHREPPKREESPPIAKQAHPPTPAERTPSKAATQEASTRPQQPPIITPDAPHLFRDFCAACHGVDGRGTAVRAAFPEIPDFTSRKWQDSRSNAQLLHSILDGKGKFMLPMKSKVGEIGARELVPYIRGFAHGKQTAPVERSPAELEHAKEAAPKEMTPPQLPPKQTPAIEAPVSGASPPHETTERVHFAAAAYRQNCSTCHGPDGRGTNMRSAMPPIPDFTNRDWQRNHTTAQLVAAVENGKGGLMPAFGGRFTLDEIRDLVTFVRAFGPVASRQAEHGETEFERRFQTLQQQWDQLERQIKELPPEQGKS